MEATEQTVKEKEAFGKALGQFPGDAWKAALSIFGEDSGRALNAFHYWINDPVVIHAKNEYLEAGGAPANLPTKAEFAMNILNMADKEGIEFRDKLSAYKLFAEIMEFMPKNNVTQVNDNRTTNVTNKVMVIPASASNEAWETKLIEQQDRLVSVAAE